MIGQLILAPFGMAYILGPKFFLLLALPLASIALNTFIDDNYVVDSVTTAVSVILVLSTLFMWVYLANILKLEVSLVSSPWCFAVFGEEDPVLPDRNDRESEGESAGATGVERSSPSSSSMASTAMQVLNFCTEDEMANNKNLCPFTGEPGEVQCTGCRAFVSRAKFHHPNPKVAKVPLGKHVTSYSSVQVAMSFVQDPLVGRVLTDQALDFKCNMLFGSVGPCCAGCFVSNRCWNTLPRLIVTCMMISVMAAAAPFAVEDASDFPTGGRIALGFISLLFGGAAPLVMADCAATSVAFMRRYPSLPYPDDGLRPSDFQEMPALARAIVAVGANKVSKAI